MGQNIVLFRLGRAEALFTLEELCPGSWLSLTAWSLQIRSWSHNGGLGAQGGSSSAQAPLVQSEYCTPSTQVVHSPCSVGLLERGSPRLGCANNVLFGSPVVLEDSVVLLLFLLTFVLESFQLESVSCGEEVSCYCLQGD